MLSLIHLINLSFLLVSYYTMKAYDDIAYDISFSHLRSICSSFFLMP